MKCLRNLCLLTLLLLSSLAIQAQGNLQFNQVINIDLTGSSAAFGDIVFQTQSISVPVGKVWKVETASCRLARVSIEGYITGTNALNTMMITVDNSPLAYFGINNSGQSNYFDQTMMPLWLPPGTHTFTLRALIQVNGVANQTGYGKISVIEFNVVP